MLKKTKDEIFSFFESQPREWFKKRGLVLFRPAIQNETVLTIVVGKLEAIKTAGANEMILRNIELGSSAETYIIDKAVFDKRYEIQPKQYTIDGQTWTEAIAKGIIEAFCYHGGTFEFVAPWDELMLCEDGDHMARPEGPNKSDIYRIEKNAFAQTYRKLEK